MDDRNSPTTPTSTSTPASRAILSEDGYVRLTFEDLLVTPMVHLMSGLDTERPAYPQREAMATNISGYTEWVSTAKPCITIGWDWRLDFSSPRPVCVRTGVAGSNIMFVDGQKHDLGHYTSLHTLESFIDTLPWQEKVLKDVGFNSP